MELRFLRTFCEAAKTKNITKAAYNLGLTQSAATHHLKTLQDELGQDLYIRLKNGIELTAAGLLLYEKALDIINLEEKVAFEVSNFSDTLRGKLAVACTNDALRGELLDIIMAFHDHNPNIRISFRTGDMVYMEYLIRYGKSDVLIGYYYDKDVSIEDTGIHIKLGLLMKHDDRLAENQVIALDKLYELPLFAPRKRTIQNLLDKNRIEYDKLNVFAEFDDPTNYTEFMRKGGRYTLCLEPSESTVRRSGLCFRPLEPEIHVYVGMKYSQNDNPCVKAFKDFYESQKKLIV